MNEAVNVDITPEQAGQLKALMEQCIEAIDAANKQMDTDEAERKQMQTETRVMLQWLKEKLHVEDDSKLPH